MTIKNKIYLVATPIGNLDDISVRALDVLKDVDFIACEDTRHSKKLLQHFDIAKPLIALHEHNETKVADKLLNDVMANDKSMALVSDAGTPLISDPGYNLVTKAHSLGVTVVPVPGPCALICALSASGLSTDKFLFAGFLPHKSSKRQEEFNKYKMADYTVIFYESTHRIIASIKDLIQTLGADKQVALARELTKKFETIIKATAKEVLSYLEQDANHVKGEFVLMLSGDKSNSEDDSQLANKLLRELVPEIGVSKAASITAKLTSMKKKTAYQLGLEYKGNSAE